VVSSNSKGDKAERELVNYLDDRGFHVMRAPTSGGGTDRALPDVFAGKNRSAVALEVKRASGDRVYVDEEEVFHLNSFADAFGATGMIAVRWDEERSDPSWGAEWPGFYLANPKTLYVTDGGNFRLDKDESFEEYIRVCDL